MNKGISRETIILSFLYSAFYKSAGETSLNDIATRLSIRKPSIYNYFESKESLVEHTINYCSTYMQSLTLIPSEITTVAQKYPLSTVFKGIVNRYYKMHDKSPLFQIYTFMKTQKYFSLVISQNIEEHNERLTKEVLDMLKTLDACGKIRKDCVSENIALLFYSILMEQLDEYLLERKMNILKNPTESGGLFPLPNASVALKKAHTKMDDFASFLSPISTF